MPPPMLHLTPRRALRLPALTGLILALGAIPATAAEAPTQPVTMGETPKPPAQPVTMGPAAWYFDGDRRVDVERMEETAPDARRRSPSLTPVRLRYEGRAGEVRAFVDRTAIV